MEDQTLLRLQAIEKINIIIAQALDNNELIIARNQLLQIVAEITGFKIAFLAEQESDGLYMQITAFYSPSSDLFKSIEKITKFRLIGYRFHNDPEIAFNSPATEVFDSFRDIQQVSGNLGVLLDKLIKPTCIAMIRQYPGNRYIGAATFIATSDNYDLNLLEDLCRYNLSFALYLMREQEAHARLSANYMGELEIQVEESTSELKKALLQAKIAEEKLRDMNLMLDEARQRAEERLLDSKLLLAGLQVLTETVEVDVVLNRIFKLLRDILNFDYAFIIKKNKNGILNVTRSTHTAFENLTWNVHPFFSRVLSGKHQAVFDINQVPEWQEQSEEIRSLVTSAIHIPLYSSPSDAMLICTHKERGFFTGKHLTLAKQFGPLAAQALRNAELYAALEHDRNNLEERIQERTSELKHERDFAMLVMESMGQGLTITNADGVYEYVNPAFAEILGVSADDIIGKTPSTFILTENDELDSNEIQESVNLSPSTYEIKFVAKNDTIIYALVSSVPRTSRGKFNGTIAVITDLTDRMRLEQMKTDFINRASHELRTPLTSAILMTDLIEPNQNDPEQQYFFSVLKEELNNQMALLEDLLTVGRLESGRYQYKIQQTDILPLIEDVCTSIEPQTKNKRVMIEVNCQQQLLQAATDGKALQQVLLNILSNAVKYSHQGGLVQISAQNALDGISITVQDYGIGIPDHDQRFIGTRFYRAKNAAQLEIPGTGLGLHIIYEIVNGISGRINIESTENEGTLVRLWIPANE